MSSSKQASVTGGRPLRKDPLVSLKMAQIMSTKPVLPAEIIAIIVDYLAVSDLIRFARVSRSMLEMVYDDARWIKRLKRMNLWNEAEARKDAERTRVDADKSASARRSATINHNLVNARGRPLPTAGTVFDAGGNPPSPGVISPPRRKSSLKTSRGAPRGSADGLDAISLSSPARESLARHADKDSALEVLKHVRSLRGQARREYGKIYQALGRYYNDAVETEGPMDCLVFKDYKTPEHQAQMLAQLRVFCNSDFAPGASSREAHLTEVIAIFEGAALLEFQKAYAHPDVDGSMKRYARVLYNLNGGQSAVDLFLHQNRLILQKGSLGSASDCIDYSSGRGEISLERTQAFFDRLSMQYREESAIIDCALPEPSKVALLLLEEIGEKLLSPYITALFDEAHDRGREAYLKVVSGVFAQSWQFILLSREENAEDGLVRIQAVLTKAFERHLDLYLAEELAFVQDKSEKEVDEWDRALSVRAASTEIFLMSNVNRQADKKDFISSFKKVVMMPANILPSFPASSSKKSTGRALTNGESLATDRPTDAQTPSRSPTTLPTSIPVSSNTPVRSSTPLPLEAPTTELAAKAALMMTKLDTIRSLFSIEVALNLVHAAKASLERVAQFMSLEGPPAEAAKSHCLAIFVVLLQILGIRHVKAGFDKAVDHLSAYNPREASASTTSLDATAPHTSNGHASTPNDKTTHQVAPLATFLELVNVGDLIQQMLDVFYETELIRLRISNRDDLLDPALKEKKKFEAMLDERVAAGLGRGIDVLMDEVEHICGTTQRATDFNPPPGQDVDVGPTATAREVVAVVGNHTSMLTGSTDKTLLDVFTTEVGLRLFTTLSKHLKRQRISTTGALPLLSDLAYYAAYIGGFKNDDLNSYFTALREVGQLFLVEVKGKHGAEEMAGLIADGERYRGVFTVEEVYEWAERRSDWVEGGVRGRVEKAMYGQGCVVM